MLALWRFIAGDSRIAPSGIALAVTVTAIARYWGWNPSLLVLVFCALLVVTLSAASFERG